MDESRDWMDEWALVMGWYNNRVETWGVGANIHAMFLSSRVLHERQGDWIRSGGRSQGRSGAGLVGDAVSSQHCLSTIAVPISGLGLSLEEKEDDSNQSFSLLSFFVYLVNSLLGLTATNNRLEQCSHVNRERPL